MPARLCMFKSVSLCAAWDVLHNIKGKNGRISLHDSYLEIRETDDWRI